MYVPPVNFEGTLKASSRYEFGHIAAADVLLVYKQVKWLTRGHWACLWQLGGKTQVFVLFCVSAVLPEEEVTILTSQKRILHEQLILSSKKVPENAWKKECWKAVCFVPCILHFFFASNIKHSKNEEPSKWSPYKETQKLEKRNEKDWLWGHLQSWRDVRLVQSRI